VGRGRRSATNRTVTSSGYAANKPLGLGEGATAEEVHAALDGHTVARGTLVVNSDANESVAPFRRSAAAV